jgi:hypothetical protein
MHGEQKTKRRFAIFIFKLFGLSAQAPAAFTSKRQRASESSAAKRPPLSAIFPGRAL